MMLTFASLLGHTVPQGSVNGAPRASTCCTSVILAVEGVVREQRARIVSRFLVFIRAGDDGRRWKPCDTLDSVEDAENSTVLRCEGNDDYILSKNPASITPHVLFARGYTALLARSNAIKESVTARG